jgi:hypothetical protein
MLLASPRTRSDPSHSSVWPDVGDEGRFTVEALRHAGFDGFTTVLALRTNRCASVPVGPGVYVVLRSDNSGPVFLAQNTGGHFKGQDPTVDLARLAREWIPGAPALYIGKANALRRRLGQLLDFGAGIPVGHWGGRFLWQLAGADNLLIGWKREAAPRVRESLLIDRFIREFGALPYANLVR